MVIPEDVLKELPARFAGETPFQDALKLAVPRLLPVWLGRQIPGLHQQTGGGWMQGMPKGAADLTGMVRGGLRIEIEVKFADGKLSPAQKRWRTVCRSWGVLHLEAHADGSRPAGVEVLAFAQQLRTALLARGVAC